MQIGGHSQQKLTVSALIFAVVLMIGFSVQTAQADPLSFSNLNALQNNDTTTVSLFSNSGVTLVGPHVTFTVDVAGTLPLGGTDTLQITYTEVGGVPIVQSFAVPFGSVQPPFTIFFSVSSLVATPQALAATLKIDLLNSSPDFIIPSGPGQGQSVNSYTYAFNVAQPVPEPATVVGFGSGLIAFAARRRRRMYKIRGLVSRRSL